MCRGRRAEAVNNASNAAVLVVIIALLIVLYVLMLPPDVRDSLLGDGGSPGTGVPPGERPDVLLSWVPQVAGPGDVETKHLPFFTVKTQTRGDVLAERSGVSVARSVFHQETDSLRFNKPANAEEVLLSFSVAQSQGRLQVALNGERIYESAIERRQPEPITLPADRLESSNELTFSVSGVGFSFWQTNTYQLSNVRVTADVVDDARADHTQRFVVTEPSSVREAHVGFVVDCFEQQGRLTLLFNEREVYSHFPACGVPIGIDIPASRLNPVENTLSWSVADGEYIIDQVEVSLLRESPDSVGEFSISRERLEDLVARGGAVDMSLRFASAGARGEVVVNGEPLAFRTDRQSFSGEITPYIRSGSNTVEVRDSSTPVALLEVRVR